MIWLISDIKLYIYKTPTILLIRMFICPNISGIWAFFGHTWAVLPSNRAVLSWDRALFRCTWAILPWTWTFFGFAWVVLPWTWAVFGFTWAVLPWTERFSAVPERFYLGTERFSALPERFYLGPERFSALPERVLPWTWAILSWTWAFFGHTWAVLPWNRAIFGNTWAILPWTERFSAVPEQSTLDLSGFPLYLSGSLLRPSIFPLYLSNSPLDQHTSTVPEPFYLGPERFSTIPDCGSSLNPCTFQEHLSPGTV